MAVTGGAHQHAAVRSWCSLPDVPEVGDCVRGGKPVVVRNLFAGYSAGVGGVVLVLTTGECPSSVGQLLLDGSREHFGLGTSAELFEEPHFSVAGHQSGRG